MIRLGVIIAMEEEAAAVLEDRFWEWRKSIQGEWTSAEYGVKMKISGCGKVYAAAAAEALAEESGIILSAGTGGSLKNHFIGSLALCRESVERDMDATPLGLSRGITPFSGRDNPVLVSCPPGIFESVGQALVSGDQPWFEARVATGDSFIADPAEGRRLIAQFDASVVDMETAAVAKICMLHEVPYLSLKIITDNAGHDAPDSFSVLVKSASETLARALRAVVLHGGPY